MPNYNVNCKIDTIEHITESKISKSMAQTLQKMVTEDKINHRFDIRLNTFLTKFVKLMQFAVNHCVKRNELELSDQTVEIEPPESFSDVDEFLNMRHIPSIALLDSIVASSGRLQYPQTLNQVLDILVRATNQNPVAGTEIGFKFDDTKAMSGQELHELLVLIQQSGILYHLDDGCEIRVNFEFEN